MVDPRSLTPQLPPAQLFIDGQYVDAQGPERLTVLNPATGQRLGEAPAAQAEDVDRAVKAARRAFEEGPWRKMSAFRRGQVLNRFAELLWARREEFALIESLNNGKTFRDALKGDVGPGAHTLSYYAEWSNKILGEVVPVTGAFHTYVLKEPVGVVGAIVPWNYPTSLAAWKLGPSLAAGCTVVLKPSELTPFTALKFGSLAQEAGLPEGVLNVVTGYGQTAGEALARHPDVDKLSFTGSTQTARRLLLASSQTNLKKLSLELGGKSPQLILEDAPLDEAVEACFWGIFSNKGEVCNAGSRVLIHEKIYDEFVARLVERARNMKVGDPLDPSTEMGAQVSQGQLEKICQFVESGLAQGAELLTGGRRDTQGDKARGFFMQPTVFGGVDNRMRIAQEEIFGPVLACLKVKDDAEALRLANDTSFGLAAALWTKDTAKAHAMARALKSGVVWLNCFNEFDDAAPFGGYKQSGWGRDLSHHAIENYLETKTVWTKLPF